MQDSKLSQLMHYIQRGWALVPLHDVSSGWCSCGRAECKSAGKHPRLSEWQRPEHLVVSESQLLAYPLACNWGLATGVVSGVWAVDYDPAHVTDPAAAGAFLLALQSAGTWSQRTGSGGQHWVFALPDDFVPNNSAKRLLAGFDVRGARRGEVSGGQIVLAPSVSAAGPYVVLSDVPVCAAPAGVLELVRPAPPRERPRQSDFAGITAMGAGRYVASALDGEARALRETAAGRNGRAWQAAARMIELSNALPSVPAFGREAVYAAWWAAAAAHPDPAVTVPGRELLSVWGSAERHVGDRPADLSAVGGAPGWMGGAGVVPFAAPGAAPPLGLSGSGGGAAQGAASVGDDQGNGRRLKVVRASDITMRATRWLWEEEGAQWMPLGGLTLLGGREGIGKSTWAYRLAAQLTTGKLPGSFFGTPRAVVVAAGEDAWAQTVVPRLAAAEADLSLVFRVDVVQPDGGVDGLSLPEDIAGLTALCVAERVALVLLDPLLGAVSGKLDSHKDAEVRKALAPLSRLADVAQVGVLGLIHLNKSTGNDLLTRLMASRAFAAVARSVLICNREENEELGSGPPAFLFGQAKSNLGRRVQFSWRYSIQGARVGFDDALQLPVFSSFIRVEEKLDGTIDDLVSAQDGPKRPAPKMTAAMTWIIEHLQGLGAISAETGAPSSAVKEAAYAAGHSEKTVRTAREKADSPIRSAHNPHAPGTVWFTATSV